MVTIVQHVQSPAGNGITDLSATIAATGSGNTLVVACGSLTGAAGISSIELGGSATGWAKAVAVENTTAPTEPMQAEVWYFTDATSGQTALEAFFSGSTYGGFDVWEILGQYEVDPGCVASAQNGNIDSTSFDSTGTPTTTAPAEFWVASISEISQTGGSHPSNTVSGSWTAEAAFSLGTRSLVQNAYQIVSSEGSADFSGTVSPGSSYAAVVATFMPAVTDVDGTETGSGADTGSVTASVPDGDTGTGTEGTPAIGVSDTGTGTGADSSTITATLSGAETGSGADAGTIGLAGSDAGSGTGTTALTASVPGADTGSGTDAGSVTATAPGADTGSGSDEGTASVPVTGLRASRLGGTAVNANLYAGTATTTSTYGGSAQ